MHCLTFRSNLIPKSLPARTARPGGDSAYTANINPPPIFWAPGGFISPFVFCSDRAIAAGRARGREAPSPQLLGVLAFGPSSAGNHRALGVPGLNPSPSFILGHPWSNPDSYSFYVCLMSLDVYIHVSLCVSILFMMFPNHY